MAMELSSQSAKRLFKQPGTFALAVVKQFRANQGVLLAGAVAYYTLLSLVPLLILILLALSHVVDEERLLVTLRASLEFVVPQTRRTACSCGCGPSACPHRACEHSCPRSCAG